MFLNRWLFRREIVEQNDLKPDEETAVFAQLEPFQGEGQKARYLESDADEVIWAVRKKTRLHDERSLLFGKEEPMNTVSVGEDLVARFFDRLESVIGQAVGAKVGNGEDGAGKRLLSPDETSKVMHLNVQTIIRWCREGKLAASKIGRRWLIPQDSIDAYLRRHELIHGKRAP